MKRAPLTAVAALALALAPHVAHAWCRTTTDSSRSGECATSGTPIYWQGLCAGYSLYTEGSPEIPFENLRATTLAAATTWQTAACDANGTQPQYFRLEALPDTTQPTGFDRNGVHSHTLSFNSVWTLDTRHRLGTIAITLVSFDPITGEIVDADLEMNQWSDANPDGFHFSTGDSSPEAADLPTILTHELGHFQGLGHSTVDTAVMWPSAGLGEQRRMLRTDDVQGICDAYSPDFAPVNDHTCNRVPFGGFAVNQYGGRVRGGCAIAPRNAPASGRSGSRGLAVAAIAVAAFAARMFSARRADRRVNTR